MEHFLPAFKVIVELSVIHPGNLAEKHVLDKVNGAQGNTAVVQGREQGVGVSMTIDGNLDHDRRTHQPADIKEAANALDSIPALNVLTQPIVKIVECLRHLS